MRVWILLACSACTIAEKQVAPDFVCSEFPVPTTAPQSVTVSGTVKSLQGTSVGAGVTIQGFSSGLMLEPTTTDANGRFSYTHDTAGVPNVASILAVAPTFVPTISYPGVLVAADISVDVRLITEVDAMAFAMTPGITIDPMLGVVLLRVTDCNESPIAGGTVVTNPAGTTYYFRLAAPDPAATETDPSGIVMIANLPLGNVELSGAVGDIPLRSHTVESVLEGFALTTLQP